MYNRNDLRRKINQRWIQVVEIGVLILVMNPPILDVWFRLLQERNELKVKLLHYAYKVRNIGRVRPRLRFCVLC